MTKTDNGLYISRLEKLNSPCVRWSGCFSNPLSAEVVGGDVGVSVGGGVGVGRGCGGIQWCWC